MPDLACHSEEEAFYLTIGLGMLSPRHYVFDTTGLEVFLELAQAFLLPPDPWPLALASTA